MSTISPAVGVPGEANVPIARKDSLDVGWHPRAGTCQNKRSARDSDTVYLAIMRQRNTQWISMRAAEHARSQAPKLPHPASHGGLTPAPRGVGVLVVGVLVLGVLLDTVGGLGVSWDWGKWWTYDGISGPQFWGLINPEWSLCTHGRRQSPVNLDPAILLFDPNLRPLHVDKHRVSGVINNTGHSVVFTLGVTGHHHPSINVTGGPLSYRYQVSHVQVHFGAGDHIGSEHTVNGTAFPAELQVYGFNAQLFSNFSEAVNRAHGVVAISVLLQLGTQGHPGLRPLTDAVQRVRWAGTSSLVERVSVRALLPDSHHYITYDGSLTQPPCHETVTWVLVNRPVYITKQQLHGLRQIHQGSKDVPKGKMLNNYRPTQQLYHRPLRTNIDFTNSRQLHCPSMAPQMYYTANTWR